MKIFNRVVNRDYEIMEKYEAGISLSGAEVKAARAGNIRLEGAHVKIIGTELFLINADISIYQYSRPDNYDPHHSRKLLLHKKEIIRLKIKLTGGSNLTIVPVSCYNKRGLIKLEIALAKGKKTWEKKNVEKNRDEKRRVEKELKEEMRG